MNIQVFLEIFMVIFNRHIILIKSENFSFFVEINGINNYNHLTEVCYIDCFKIVKRERGNKINYCCRIFLF